MAERLDFALSQELRLDYMKACIRAAVIARMFVWSTDDEPLVDMSFDQGALWDDLAAAVSVLEEMESE